MCKGKQPGVTAKIKPGLALALSHPKFQLELLTFSDIARNWHEFIPTELRILAHSLFGQGCPKMYVVHCPRPP